MFCLGKTKASVTKFLFFLLSKWVSDLRETFMDVFFYYARNPLHCLGKSLPLTGMNGEFLVEQRASTVYFLQRVENTQLYFSPSYNEMSRRLSPSTSYKDNNILPTKSRKQNLTPYRDEWRVPLDQRLAKIDEEGRLSTSNKKREQTVPHFCFLQRDE